MQDEKNRRASREPVAKSDDDDFRKIWLLHLPYLHAHALRYCGSNPAVAEDALSETMLKAAKAYSGLAIRNRRAWLLRLVHQVCMDRQRNNRRQSRVDKDITNA